MGKVVELRRFLTTFPQFDQGPSLMNWRGSWTTYRRIVELPYRRCKSWIADSLSKSLPKSSWIFNFKSAIQDLNQCSGSRRTRELVELIVLGSTFSRYLFVNFKVSLGLSWGSYLIIHTCFSPQYEDFVTTKQLFLALILGGIFGKILKQFRLYICLFQINIKYPV